MRPPLPSFIQQSALDARQPFDNLTHVEMTFRPKKSSIGCALAIRLSAPSSIKGTVSRASSQDMFSPSSAGRRMTMGRSSHGSTSSERSIEGTPIKRLPL